MNKVKINYKIFNRGDLIMLSKDLLEALNDQMNHEYFALMLIWQWSLIAMMLHMKVSLTSISNKLKKNVSTVKKSMIISTIGEH